jgi:sugar/nucleoside kinase (ribokinase family)
MVALVPLEPVDYLVIGHVTEDVTPAGLRLGGTAAYSALTARALGLRVGVITCASARTSLAALDGIPILRAPSDVTTTFENIRTPTGRQQILRKEAPPISLGGMPDVWRRSAIVHLGPVAQEIPAAVEKEFSPSLLGMTPQGWMRAWDDGGRVTPCAWESGAALLPKAGAVVISREDVQGDDEVIEAMSHQTHVLAVTEGFAGCVLYWNGDRRRFRAPQFDEVDAVGAGDIFAAAFFVRLYATRDPWESARFATLLASHSITRPGLEGIPTLNEIEMSSMEVLK